MVRGVTDRKGRRRKGLGDGGDIVVNGGCETWDFDGGASPEMREDHGRR